MKHDEKARTFEDLARMSTAALEALYAGGAVPASLEVLDGRPTCRALAVRGLDRWPLAAALRRLAAWPRFPWAGKTFSSIDATHGTGINRVRLGRGREWFPFRTGIGASALDGAPCVRLDYDLPDNPATIRRVRDELREVAPGLFLGPALLEGGGGTAHRVLFFACRMA